MKKVISRHSRTWINKELSSMLSDLKELRKKFQKHRSMTNQDLLEEKRRQVEDYMEREKELYKIEQCKRIAEANSDKEKWSIINKLTNSTPRMSVQPIRKCQNGKEEYVFEDHEIIKEMEDYHICKEGAHEQEELSRWIEEQKEFISADSDPNDIMNFSIQPQEVDKTCLGSPRPDGFRGNLVDNADRETTRDCLVYLYDKAWEKGLFLAEWKEEDRAVLAKGDKDDYHVVNAYRTISLTAVLGKRFEKITAARLIAVLESSGFDPDQFAYLQNRSGVQALITLLNDGQNCGI